jgi:hypothetical protein
MLESWFRLVDLALHLFLGLGLDFGLDLELGFYSYATIWMFNANSHNCMLHMIQI